MEGCEESGGVSIVVKDEGVASRCRCVGEMNGEKNDKGTRGNWWCVYCTFCYYNFRRGRIRKWRKVAVSWLLGYGEK